MKIFYLSLLFIALDHSIYAQCNSATIFANDSTNAVPNLKESPSNKPRRDDYNIRKVP